MEDMKKIREETIRKWEKSGFLDGLTGLTKTNIAELYECCKSYKIPNEETVTLPAVRRIFEKIKHLELW